MPVWWICVTSVIFGWLLGVGCSIFALWCMSGPDPMALDSERSNER